MSAFSPSIAISLAGAKKLAHNSSSGMPLSRVFTVVAPDRPWRRARLGCVTSLRRPAHPGLRTFDHLALIREKPEHERCERWPCDVIAAELSVLVIIDNPLAA